MKQKFLLSAVSILFASFTLQAGLVDSMFLSPITSAMSGKNQLNNLEGSSSYYVPSNLTIYYPQSGLDTDKVFDYKTQEIGAIDFQKLYKPMEFKKNLTVDQYNTLIRSWLNSLSNANLNSEAWGIIYFVRALAENVFSNNGTLYPDFFNKVLDKYNYCK